MPLDEIMAVVGVAVQGTLALLLLVAWRSLKARWALLLSAGFIAVTLQYCCVAVGHYTSGARWIDPPANPNAVFSLIAQGLITWSLITYVDVPLLLGRRLRAHEAGREDGHAQHRVRHDQQDAGEALAQPAGQRRQHRRRIDQHRQHHDAVAGPRLVPQRPAEQHGPAAHEDADQAHGLDRKSVV